MKKKGGRPSKYETEWKDRLVVIEGWARDGLTDEQIAKNIGISTSTLYEWKKKYSEFSEALKRGKEVVDREVENALLKRALGYEYEEITKERVLKKDEKGDPMVDSQGFPIYELVTTKVVTKQVVPDTTAQIFWLKNRKPHEWRDKKDIEHNGSLEVKNDDTTRRIEQQLEQDDESRELLKEFFRRSKEISGDGKDISEG